jgi:hypothetical protein
MIVADLFAEQCRPWEAIARAHVDKVWKAASHFVELVVAHKADTSTAKALQHQVFDPAMKTILNEMREKTTELLTPHQDGHPITYNHYFTETLQKVRHERGQRDRERIIREFFGTSSLGSYRLDGDYDLKRLSDSLAGSGGERDMERFAANEAMDCLNAYYKVIHPPPSLSHPLFLALLADLFGRQ